MHVTLRQLQVFEAVARHLSFTRAAEELYLSQPAVSMQVKKMESAVGLSLFEHVGKRVHLTEAGREMQHYARGIHALLAEADQVVDDLKGLRRGRLSVTVASTVNYFATRVMAVFAKRHPGVRINLGVTNREELLRQLDANQTDIVLMGRPPENRELVAEAFLDNPLVVVASADHRLVGTRVSLARLAQETFMLREPGSGTRMAMERFFADHAMQPIGGMVMNSNEAIKQSVEAGLGLGVVSAHTVELELEAKRLCVLDVEHFPIRRQWYVVHRADKRLSRVAATFKDFVRAEAVALSTNN